MTMKLTVKEAAVLNLIAHDQYQPVNGERPLTFSETSAVWTFSVATSAAEIMQPRQFAGVCSNLKKKGLIDCYKGTTEPEGQDPSTITMTEAGFAAWQGSQDVPAPAPAKGRKVVTVYHESDRSPMHHFAIDADAVDAVLAQLADASDKGFHFEVNDLSDGPADTLSMIAELTQDR